MKIDDEELKDAAQCGRLGYTCITCEDNIDRVKVAVHENFSLITRWATRTFERDNQKNFQQPYRSQKDEAPLGPFQAQRTSKKSLR